MSYFHDAEFIFHGDVIREKGRLYKNVYKDGTFLYKYECKYYVNDRESIETGISFSDPAWACALQSDIDKAIIRRMKI